MKIAADLVCAALQRMFRIASFTLALGLAPYSALAQGEESRKDHRRER